jgi:tetratricopeptide (TPR) repeat protein
MLAHAQGKDEEAIADLRAAADLEGSMERHPVTPGSIVPMRELLANLLLDLNQPAQALSEYERSLTADSSSHSLYGAAKAAGLSGGRARAKDYYRQLVVLGSRADPEMPQLAEAKGCLLR